MSITGSSVKEGRQSQGEQTKTKLFEAAVELLNEKEFEQITIRDIIARAQVSIGTFYNYYPTKMEVFYETYRFADDYFDATVAPALTQPRTYDRILCFFHYYAHYCSEITDLKMSRLLYNPNNRNFNRSTGHGMLTILQGVIQEGLDRGELLPVDPAEKIMNYLMISARGLVYHWCTCDGSYSLKEMMEWYITRLLQAYLPAAPQAE